MAPLFVVSLIYLHIDIARSKYADLNFPYAVQKSCFMKSALRKVFYPILSRLEKGDGVYAYKPSSRKILIVIGFLFLFLSLATAFVGIVQVSLGVLLPVFVFSCVGTVCLVVGFLGSDRAVAKIWGS